jgi:hypothetical protein
MKLKLRNRLIGAVAAVGVLGLSTANAAVWTLNPTPNSSGNTVAASADITANGNVFNITLTNLSPSLTAANQGLSDLLINFTTDIAGVSGFTQAGQLINVNANGTTTNIAGSPTRWNPSIVAGNLYLTSLGGGQPDEMIAPDNIGVPNGGVPNFNPYIDTMAQFTLTVPGASNLSIAGVQFSFGTSPTEFVANGVCSSGCGVVPEPSSWAMMILGFFGMGATLRSRRRFKLSALA